MERSLRIRLAAVALATFGLTAYAEGSAQARAEGSTQGQATGQATAPRAAQAFKTPRPVEIARVKGHLYIITGEGGNVALYVTGAGVILVADMFYRNADDIVAKVATVTKEPIVYV